VCDFARCSLWRAPAEEEGALAAAVGLLPRRGRTSPPLSSTAAPAAAVGVVNTAYVTVTLCAPGGTTCQTIDHVSVDTGSYGFRVIASVLNSSLAQALAPDTGLDRSTASGVHPVRGTATAGVRSRPRI